MMSKEKIQSWINENKAHLEYFQSSQKMSDMEAFEEITHEIEVLEAVLQ